MLSTPHVTSLSSQSSSNHSSSKGREAPETGGFDFQSHVLGLEGATRKSNSAEHTRETHDSKTTEPKSETESSHSNHSSHKEKHKGLKSVGTHFPQVNPQESLMTKMAVSTNELTGEKTLASESSWERSASAPAESSLTRLSSLASDQGKDKTIATALASAFPKMETNKREGEKSAIDPKTVAAKATLLKGEMAQVSSGNDPTRQNRLARLIWRRIDLTLIQISLPAQMERTKV